MNGHADVVVCHSQRSRTPNLVAQGPSIVFHERNLTQKAHVVDRSKINITWKCTLDIH